jgi:long-chain acyl-CoA synthetase
VLRDAGRQGKLQQLALLRNSIQPDDVFTIIYTSGTTGRAKGVMLSHRNVVSTVTATADHTRLPANECRALSFLPLSHIFERAGVLYYLLTGSGVYFSSVEALSGSLAEVRPHTFSAVPRVLEKVHEKLHARAATLKGWQRRCICGPWHGPKPTNRTSRHAAWPPSGMPLPTVWCIANGVPPWVASYAG